MVRSLRRANNSAAIIWSRQKISMLRSRSLRGFPARASARSRCGQSWFIIDGEAVIPGREANPESRDSGFASSMGPGMTATSGAPMIPTDIEKIFRDEAGPGVGAPIRLLRGFDSFEEGLQGAFRAGGG